MEAYLNPVNWERNLTTDQLARLALITGSDSIDATSIICKVGRGVLSELLIKQKACCAVHLIMNIPAIIEQHYGSVYMTVSRKCNIKYVDFDHLVKYSSANVLRSLVDR